MVPKVTCFGVRHLFPLYAFILTVKKIIKKNQDCLAEVKGIKIFGCLFHERVTVLKKSFLTRIVISALP